MQSICKEGENNITLGNSAVASDVNTERVTAGRTNVGGGSDNIRIIIISKYLLYITLKCFIIIIIEILYH